MARLLKPKVKIPKAPTIKDVPKYLTADQADKFLAKAKVWVRQEVEGQKHDLDLIIEYMCSSSYVPAREEREVQENKITVDYWHKEIKKVMREYVAFRRKVRKAEAAWDAKVKEHKG